MALAILELGAFEGPNVRFSIDTGTNRYYQLKIGRSVERRLGIDWVEEVIFATRITANEAAGDLLNSAKEIAVPTRRLEVGHAYAQLFTFKDAHGKSPAFSPILKVPLGASYIANPADDFAPSFSMSTVMNTNSFNVARRVPCRTYADKYARAASLEDLLAGIVKIAAPAVLNILSGGPTGAQTGAGAGATAGSSGAANAGGGLDILAALLKTILGNVPGGLGAIAKPQSLLNPVVRHNRFASTQSVYAQPFIFGVDDALIGALAGPLLNVLPQLMNSANQGRIQLKQADNKLVTDLLSEVDRSFLLDQLLAAQRQQPAAGEPDTTAEVTQLLQLLQQAAPPATAPPAPAVAAPSVVAPKPAPAPTAPVTTKSLSTDPADNSVLSNKAVVAFATAAPISWNGSTRLVFARGQRMQLKVQLKVAEPAPRTALPKAIFKIILQDASDQSVRLEKTLKQKDVMANTAIPVPFEPDELTHLPVNKPISALAEIRWLTKSGKQYKALGSTEIVLVNKYFLKEQGREVSTEQELFDMKQYRPFWNQVWESPLLSSGSNGSDQKTLWQLDVSGKYSVLLSPDHDANGLMQTRVMKSEPDADSLSETVAGKLKAGIELSIAELNKLMPLWPGETSLDREKLEALQTTDFAKNNACEFIYNFKLKGRKGERGMVWVIPTFKLFECTLSSSTANDDSGQITALANEKVRFPLPVAARIIGLKSQ